MRHRCHGVAPLIKGPVGLKSCIAWSLLPPRLTSNELQARAKWQTQQLPEIKSWHKFLLWCMTNFQGGIDV